MLFINVSKIGNAELTGCVAYFAVKTLKKN